MKPNLIITVGSIALKSMTLFFPSSGQLNTFKLKNDTGKVIRDTTPWVYPLYHTSWRGRTHRDAKKQKLDWLKIPFILEEIKHN